MKECESALPWTGNLPRVCFLPLPDVSWIYRHDQTPPNTTGYKVGDTMEGLMDGWVGLQLKQRNFPAVFRTEVHTDVHANESFANTSYQCHANSQDIRHDSNTNKHVTSMLITTGNNTHATEASSHRRRPNTARKGRQCQV